MSVATPTAHCCLICGADLSDHPRALTCSARCRRERSRFMRLLSGYQEGPYGFLAAYLERERHPRRRAVQSAETGDLREVVQ
jgi:hypothetical protein